jgi:uncharacterized protein
VNYPTTGLYNAVRRLAAATINLSDADLGQPYRWGAHEDEGTRFALLGSMHELRALAVHLAAERRRDGPPMTRAQHALAQYHAAYRDLQAVLQGVTAEEYEQPPAPGEWPLRYVYAHMVGAERHFFALVHYGLRRQRESGESIDYPPKLPDGEANRLLGPFEEFYNLMETGSMADMAAYHAVQHDRALVEFAGMSDAEIDGPSIWWEGEPFTLEYRLHRMDAHLRQHTIQVEKTLDAVRGASGEAQRLLRLVYAALAEVEAAAIGAPDLGAAEQAALAAQLVDRSAEVTAAVARAHEFVAAIKVGDSDRVTGLLAGAAGLANATDDAGVPAARLAVYHGRPEIAAALAEAGAELQIWDGAALGRLEIVEAAHKRWGEFILNDYSRDGHTPLGLAAFFGHEDIARWLIEKGADVHAVSQNPMRVQPLHSAVAGNHTEIARLLLAAGADANAEQQDGFRPLHAAAQNGNAELVALLLEYGADPSLADARGRTALDLAGQSTAVKQLVVDATRTTR